MAFSDFKKVSEVQEKFGIKYTASDFFEVSDKIDFLIHGTSCILIESTLSEPSQIL